MALAALAQPEYRISYSVPDAAKAVGVSRSALYTFIQSKALPIVKIGNRTLIRHVDLQQFVDDRVT